MWLTLDDRWGYRVESRTVPCPALRQPMRILHLSDAHLLPRDRAKQAFIRRVTDDDFDLVAFTGDVAETPEAEPLVPGLLSRPPRLGAYMVLGNHDRLRQTAATHLRSFLSQRAAEEGDRPEGAALKARYEAGGAWRVLLNEAVSHTLGDQTLVVVGVDDPYTGHGDLQAAMRGVKRADVLIGLVHVPTDLASFSQRSFHLVLAGHTHGGQIRLPGLGAVLTQCDLHRRHAAGLHWHERTAVHVSKGLGAGPLIRLRFNCPPTAHVLTLVPV